MTASTAYRTPGVHVEWLDANPQHLEIGRTDTAGFVGIAERGPVQAPTKIESAIQYWTTFGDPVPGAYLAEAVEGFFANGGRTCWIVRAADPARAAPARARLLVPRRAPFALEAVSPGTWGNQISIAPVWGRGGIVELAVTAPGRTRQLIDLDALDAGRSAGKPRPRSNLLGVADDALPELAPQVLVRIVSPDGIPLPLDVLDVHTTELRLRGGDDGLASLAVDHVAGDRSGTGVWGVAALERIDGISFVAAPDLMIGPDLADGGVLSAFDAGAVVAAQTRIVASCARCRDRIAILDLPRADREQALLRRMELPSASHEASWAAAYHPWIVVDGPSRGAVRAIPPSGHVAGVYARADRLRGAHKPPANEVLERAWDVVEALDDRAHGELNDAGVNAIRALPGRGVLVLGARTLETDDVRWRFVNVRRLFAMLERALERQMQWLVFETNGPPLWRQVDRALRGFLERLFRAGMLDGATSEQAYFVRCDASTNPVPQIDEGRVTSVVGIQPPFPAEFVVVRIGVTRNGIEVEEKGAQDA